MHLVEYQQPGNPEWQWGHEEARVTVFGVQDGAATLENTSLVVYEDK